jgi:hypothetical protein
MNRYGMLVLGVVAVSGCKRGDSTDEPITPDNTPVQHSDISPRPPKGCGSGFWGVHYGDAYKTLREAEEYKAGARDYYVRELSDRRNEYLLSGISPSFRQSWLGSHKIADKDFQCIVPLFDEIGAAAKRTLPKFHPRGYIHHDSDDEKVIKDALKAELPDADIIDTGVSSATWQIEKLYNGTPSSRYKYGMAWVKSAKFDDGFCRLVFINVVQDYSGGGNYGESQGRYISMTPAGCK